MSFIKYIDNDLSMDEVLLKDVAHSYGTPTYVYSGSNITARYDCFNNSLKKTFAGTDISTQIHFAVKSNSNQAIISLLGGFGCGVDIVSGGELLRALKAGISADKIIFSGVAKTDEELSFALKTGILQINIESEAEIYRLHKIATELNIVANVALRINPDIDAKTMDKISTGKKTDKFGVDIEVARELYNMNKMKYLNPVSIAVHIGSQLLSAEPFVKTYELVALLGKQLLSDNINIKRLDLGGGLGIAYGQNDTVPDIHKYTKMVYDTFNSSGFDLHFEPGRWLVGGSGVLLGRVEDIKTNSLKTFILCNVAMNDLIRPTLYGAYHHILPTYKNAHTIKADLVGPVCESGDYICKDKVLPNLKRGDLFAVTSVGAYGFVLSSNYNTRTKPSEVLILDGVAHLIRAREKIEDLIGKDMVPKSLKKQGKIKPQTRYATS